MPDSPSASREKLPSRFSSLFRRKWSGKDVAILVLARSFVSMSAFAFREPWVGEGREVLDPAPAAISLTLGGSWKWQDTNALRFEPSGGLPVASEFKVEVDPEKVIQEGQVFTGETEVHG